MNRPMLLSAALTLMIAGSSHGQAPTALSPEAQKLAEQVRQTHDKVTAEVADVEMHAKAEAMIAKAAAFLRSRQDKATGGWSTPKPDADGKSPPVFPAITGLVLMGLLDDPTTDARNEAAVQMGVKFLLNHQQPDGGIYDKVLPCYNTALAVSALSRVHTPQAREAAQRGVMFLKSLQWSEVADGKTGGAEAPKPVQRDHPFYGGVGYGRHSRPDNSNLAMFMQALEDAGVSPQDEAVKRALVFLRRTQMDDRVNPEKYAKGSRQGGFVYSTVENAESVESRPGQSEAGVIEETLSDGTVASRLRAYGSMTYAGFKSLIYAELPKHDQRVAAAMGWIRRNYTVDENPGIGAAGQYYYYLTFSRALRAWGEPTIKTLSATGEPSGAPGERNWRADLVNKLAGLQSEDGSFKSVGKRWMEDNPDLITAYALEALCEAMR
ncbi:MAG TPA: prenyltransferase/squalene oxidase repeat-containing protein [Phycisphaerales bacterium]|nr:prenyltransferase/squalene oxidase repeat-containing protein [Phycisphaerales bacterium]